MLITNGTISTPGMRRRTIARQINFGPLSLRIVTIVIFAAAALITLAQSTAGATKSYKVQSLEADVTKHEDDLDRMKNEAVRLQALQRVVGAETPTPSPTSKMEQPDTINFLPTSQPATISQLPTDTNNE